MNTELVTLEPEATIPTRIERQMAPMLFAGTPKGEKRFWEFFTANIRNPNTRMAYLTATYRFADWCEAKNVALEQVEPMVVAAYVELLTKSYAPATVKQHLAAIRMLFDWLVIGQIVPFNPASSVRGPKHVVRTGKTPVLTAAETRELLNTIDTTVLVGLRDRLLIGLMVYSFARVSAAVSMTVADYYTQGKRSFFRLHEKGGKYLVVPAHHVAIEYMDEYIAAAGIAEDRKGPLFRSSGQGRQQGVLLRTAMTRQTAIKMIKRRVFAAGLPDEISNHSFRGTGITEFLRGGGDLDVAARIAGHESTRTTQLYNRVHEELSLDEIERIHI
jgi:integrase/recombinase XerD